MGNLEKRIETDLMSAMKEKDSVKVSTLRSVKTAIQNEKTKGSFHELTDADVVKVIKKEMKQREEAEEIYRNANREELANKEQNERLVLEVYVPPMLSENELSDIVEHLIVELNASSMKDMGRIMGELNKRYPNGFDGKIASTIVKKHLS